MTRCQEIDSKPSFMTDGSIPTPDSRAAHHLVADCVAAILDPQTCPEQLHTVQRQLKIPSATIKNSLSDNSN